MNYIYVYFLKKKQALLANMASLYGVYHGPDGLKKIADRVHGMAGIFAAGASKLGHGVTGNVFFDTVRVEVADANQVMSCALELGINLRKLSENSVTVSFDETTTLEDVDRVLKAFNKGSAPAFSAESLAPEVRNTHRRKNSKSLLLFVVLSMTQL